MAALSPRIPGGSVISRNGRQRVRRASPAARRCPEVQREQAGSQEQASTGWDGARPLVERELSRVETASTTSSPARSAALDATRHDPGTRDALCS